ncbi:MAG TPA: tRNA (adenosine(37)-N6)-threonylcarbamoyltransferase complex transferase subunit TsaD, partial [Gammaproteobacteria bacterium]|nr:tRNA (adenosine(37)-N6)-threonylcarbamoyltransferase complex transferase subunit TsaD [Gammaproteobacteria bacterium]
MRILGIESSCDETGIAIYDSENHHITHELYSQIKTHAPFGGVVPELASRDHIQKTLPLIQQVLQKSKVTPSQINGIAYTSGPGLAGALMVGSMIARSLAFAWKVPAIAVHHMEGHLLAPMLEPLQPTYPFVALLVSGGHTLLISVEKAGQYQILGESLDDAAGEAFDKVARLLGLSYPGGPAIEKAAEEGDPRAFDLPRAWLEGTWSFSFSGLKTAVLREVRKIKSDGLPLPVADLAASFQAAVVDVLIGKTLAAAREFKAKEILIAGGVSANRALRQAIPEQAELPVHIPPISLCTDNAAMV